MHKFWLLLLLVAVGITGTGLTIAEQKVVSTVAASPAGGLVVSGWKGDACVEPVPVMRREHMDFLLKQRDETMHHGVRTGPYSLKKCIACHVQEDEHGGMIPINAQGQFCQSCHQYAAVRIDCFQCHTAITGSAE